MRRCLALFIGFTLVAAVPLPAAHASASQRVLVVEGRGYGHGRGLSQWGARGMAERGANHRRIVAHYYRGARVTVRPGGERIRVLVDQPSRMIVGSNNRYAVYAGSRRVAVSSSRARYFRVRPASSSMSLVESASSLAGPWKRVATTGARVTFSRSRGPIALYRSGTWVWYRGELEAVRAPNRSWYYAVNDLPLESYLLGVVPREMPALWPLEALKAQAMAARTYAVRAKLSRSSRPYHLCATQSCQVYLGYARRDASGRIIRLEHPRTSAAVRGTARRILTYGGRPIVSYYSSSSGGYTANGGAPYLRAVPDPYDRSPHARWRVTFPVEVVEERWPALGRLRGVRVAARSGGGQWGGRAGSVHLLGTEGSLRVSGETFRYAVGLKSTWFTVGSSTQSGRYVFRYNLGYGMRDGAVAELQRRLRAEGHFPSDQSITTYFGPITRDSVKRYQRAHRISTTGYVGPETRRVLNG